MYDTEGVTPRPWCQTCVRARACVAETAKRREAADSVSYVYIYDLVKVSRAECFGGQYTSRQVRDKTAFAFIVQALTSQ